jgi:hypothetical protein
MDANKKTLFETFDKRFLALRCCNNTCTARVNIQKEDLKPQCFHLSISAAGNKVSQTSKDRLLWDHRVLTEANETSKHSFLTYPERRAMEEICRGQSIVT